MPNAEAMSSKRIAVNGGVLAAVRLVMPMLSLLVVVAISRLLGLEGLGRYTLAFSYFYLFTALSPLGMYAIVTRDGAREPDQLSSLLADSVTLGALASLIATGAMMTLPAIAGYDRETGLAIRVLSLAILPYTVGNLIEGAFAARERMDLIAASSLVETMFKLLVSLGLLWAGFGLQAVMVAAVAARFLGTLVAIVMLPMVGVRFRVAWHPRRLKRVAGLAPTFLLISLFATIYWRIDIFMLSKLRSVSDVGLYGAAWRVLDLALIVPKSFCLALYPQIASLAAENTRRLRELGDTALRYLVAAAVLMATLASVNSGSLLSMLYGKDFGGASGTLNVLIWTLVPYVWVRYHAYVLVGVDRQRADLMLNLTMCLLNVVLNLLLIPSYGHQGAAYATLASICVYGVGQFAYLSAYLPQHMSHPRLPLVVIGAGAITAVTCVILSRVHFVIGVVVAPVIYAGVLLAGRFFSTRELEMLNPKRWIRGSVFVRLFEGA